METNTGMMPKPTSLRMPSAPMPSELATAVMDLRDHTLSHLANKLSKLVCLASMRDYNTGRYYHDGLAHRHSAEYAADAIEACHHELFRDLLSKPLRELVDELRAYFQAAGTPSNQAEQVWEEIEPYRVLVPSGTDPVPRSLFVSNIRIALAVLRAQSAGASPCTPRGA